MKKYLSLIACAIIAAMYLEICSLHVTKTENQQPLVASSLNSDQDVYDEDDDEPTTDDPTTIIIISRRDIS